MIFGYINKLTPDSIIPVPEWLSGSEVEREPSKGELESMNVSMMRKSFVDRYGGRKGSRSKLGQL